MEAVNSWLATSAVGPGLLVLLLAVGAAVYLLAYGISLLVAGATDPVRRRLAEVTASSQQSRASRTFDLGWFVGPLAKYVVPKTSAERDSTLTHLVQAGFRSPQALRNFYGIKAMLAIALPLVLLVGARWMPELSTNNIIFVVVLGAFIGVRL